MFFTVVNGKKIILKIAGILVVLIMAITLSVTGYAQVFNGKPLKKLPIYSVERSDNKIAISFDCAWGVDYTDKLLEIMQAENVKCTFFTVEFWTKKYPDYIKKIDQAGHEIGTHSATHPHMAKLNRESVIKELKTSSQAITQITGKKVEVFRPPFGEYNDQLIDCATELGLYTIQWDVDSLDWKDLSAKEIRQRVVDRVKSGSIVLFHNQGLHTADALLDIIRQLKAKGFEFVSIGELIYKDNYVMGADGRQIKNS